MNGAPNEALGYSDPQGRPELRGALADYLARARGVRVSAERIVVCSGFTQGFGLLCRVLRAGGARTLAIEEFAQPGMRDILAASRLNLRTVPVDPLGAAIDELADADAVLLTPAHQFPLGVPLAAQRRAQVVAWARRTGGLVIEDDYDGEFRYDRQPLGSLQALAPDHVVCGGTASKSLAPGLRLAWFVLPARLIDEVVEAKALADRQSGTLDQLNLAEFIRSGSYDRHVRRARIAYRRRRDRLLAALRANAEVRVTGIAAGLHALVELPADCREEDVISRAAQHGLALEGLHAYTDLQPHHRPALVVGYGTPPEHAFTAAIARLGAVLAELSQPRRLHRQGW